MKWFVLGLWLGGMYPSWAFFTIMRKWFVRDPASVRRQAIVLAALLWPAAFLLGYLRTRTQVRRIERAATARFN